MRSARDKRFEDALRGLVPRIHVFISGGRRRGWPGQARPKRNRQDTLFCFAAAKFPRPDWHLLAHRAGFRASRPWSPGLVVALALLAAGAAGAAPPRAVEARHGMVVTSQHIASAVGAGILAAGGNAIDAAVAVGYALAVVEPCCGNIGGGGFMTLHLADGRDTFINFRETAPAAATAGMYLDPAGKPIPDAQPLRLARHRRAGDGDGARPGAPRVRQAAARNGDGAGDRIGARRLRAEPGRRRAARRQGRPTWRRIRRRPRSFCGPTAAISSPATVSCKRILQRHWRRSQKGPGRLLQGTRRRGGSRGERRPMAAS